MQTELEGCLCRTSSGDFVRWQKDRPWCEVIGCSTEVLLETVHMHLYTASMIRETRYDECYCFALRQAARYVTQLYERHLEPVRVTSAQFTILGKLEHRPKLRIADLAVEMMMDRTTLTRALKPLERDGCIEAEPSGDDARIHLLSLTERGRRVFEQAAAAWRTAHEEFEEKFGHARADALRSELFALTGGAASA